MHSPPLIHILWLQPVLSQGLINCPFRHEPRHNVSCKCSELWVEIIADGNVPPDWASFLWYSVTDVLPLFGIYPLKRAHHHLLNRHAITLPNCSPIIRLIRGHCCPSYTRTLPRVHLLSLPTPRTHDTPPNSTLIIPFAKRADQL